MLKNLHSKSLKYIYELLLLSASRFTRKELFTDDLFIGFVRNFRKVFFSEKVSDALAIVNP